MPASSPQDCSPADLPDALDLPAGLSARELRVPGAPEDLLEGWLQAMARGFQARRPSPEFGRHTRTALAEDGARVVGVWSDEVTVADPAVPVATFADWDGTLNAGGPEGPVPVLMVTEVTVAASHRRRGLLRAMMADSLRQAAARDVPLAALTVSEGGIYGRFGFGPATALRHVEVDAARFALRDPAAAGAGTVEMVDPARLWPVVQQVFDRFHARTRGSVSRPSIYGPVLSGAFSPSEHGEDHRLRGAVHLDDAGVPDGHVLYRHLPDREHDRRVVEVVDLVAEPTAYLALWRFLAETDLVDRIRWDDAPVEGDPLPWALTDPRAVRTTGLEDLIWLRVLDVPAALEHRPWAADGAVVLAVEDPLDLTTGRYRVTTAAGTARVDVLDPDPAADDLRLGVDTLAALHLGGTTSRTLADAGRLAGPADVLATWVAMSDHAGPTAYCVTGF